jgi:hypothetical protein
MSRDLEKADAKLSKALDRPVSRDGAVLLHSMRGAVSGKLAKHNVDDVGEVGDPPLLLALPCLNCGFGLSHAHALQTESKV